MNLPNSITLARIILVPIFLYVLLRGLPYGGIIAAGIFTVAAISDGVDGYLARKNKEVTRLGKFLDPLADKLLVSAALIALVEQGVISTGVAMMMVGREMAVTGLRGIAAAEGTIIAAGPWGKAKTVVQIVFIIAAILAHSLPMGWPLQVLAHYVSVPMLWAAVALTIWSGIDYGLGYIRGLKAQVKEPRRFRFRVRLPKAWKVRRIR
ncbi:MAG TPA: CDP-diacylglycerol--glycerol-3-phosphate 3-phosphatidyltransferase [Symbiobacteriaceae bacterium]|nr:CDP-diacylglycerol--glycerol-3-phosphate 3-phosphatidyltransferase [Symbiobacteriaceae bacterium]